MAHRHGFGDGGSGGGGGGPIVLAGDVTGLSNANVVGRFATYPIELTAPSVGDVWQWTGAIWDHLQQPITFLVPAVPSTSITSNRSADQSTTTAGRVGVTNLGNDTTGAAAGATGDYATIVGGNGNSAGDGAAAVGGLGNTASGYFSAMLGAETSTISAASDFAAVVGGTQNAISGTAKWSAMIGGSSNVVSALRSAAVGGYRNVVATSDGAVTGGIGAQTRQSAQVAQAGGQTEAAGAGNRQWTRMVVRGDTPGAAPAETVDLGISGYGVAPTQTTFALLDDRAYLVTVRVTGVRTSGSAGEGRSLTVQAYVRRTAGAVTVVAQHLVSSIGDQGCCLYDVDAIASGGALIVRAGVGASNTHATRWVGTVEWEEVKYA